MSMFVEENTERIQHEKDAQIMVVIGNPPYNAGQKNENDNNKNRRYPVVDGRIRETYAKDSQAQLNNKLYDPYVRFFRWAIDRLQGRDGIVCFVTNNSFIDQIAFDGMRKHLLQDFTQIYHLDLHANIRKNSRLSGTTHNVFGIQLGVGITIAVRNSQNATPKLYYHRVPEYWRRTEKLNFLANKGSIVAIEWLELHPDARHRWLTEGIRHEFATFLPMGTKEAKARNTQQMQSIFKTYSPGTLAGRDSIVYGFRRVELATRIKEFIEDYNVEVSRWARNGRPKDIDNFVHYDRIKWSEHLKDGLKRERYGKLNTQSFRISQYRPFCKRWCYYDSLLFDRPGSFDQMFPNTVSEAENCVICVPGVGDRKGFGCFATNSIPSYDLAFEKAQCFPYYTYAEDGSNRRENITDWVLAQFREKYGLDVTKWDIFHFVYAMLHHPQYCEYYAENLKRDLPHIPLLHSKEAFHTSKSIGKQLIDRHLHYERAMEYPLKWIENREVPFSWRVEKMKLTPDKTAIIINESLTLLGIPQECFSYRLGSRSALEWVIEQYQVSTDKRSGIVSDPNNLDDEEYIVRLIGKVITVSVETVQLVNELAQAVKMEDWLGETLEITS